MPCRVRGRASRSVGGSSAPPARAPSPPRTRPARRRRARGTRPTCRSRASGRGARGRCARSAPPMAPRPHLCGPPPRPRFHSSVRSPVTEGAAGLTLASASGEMARPRSLLSAFCLGGLLAASCSSPVQEPKAQPSQAAPAAPAVPAAKADERGAILAKEQKGLVSLEEAGAVAGRFLVSGNALPPKHAVDWYRLEYQSTDREEKPLKVAGQLFVPKTDQAATLPIYVFGPGTTGLNDQCAPSAEQPGTRSWGDFQSHLITYAAQGYVAVMPDYEGFNDGPRLHHYYVGEQQARVMLDAARAALRYFDDAPGKAATKQNPVFVSGYS